MGKGWGGSTKMMTSTEPSASTFSVFPCLCNPLTASDSSYLAARDSFGTGAEPLVQGVLGHFPLFQGPLDCATVGPWLRWCVS